MKYSKEEVYQVQTEMVGLKSWLKIRTKKKEQKCPECKRLYEEIGENIALMTLHGKPNTHLCNDCGRKYIEIGAIDINKVRQDRKDLIEEIKNIKDFTERTFEGKSIQELRDLLNEVTEEHELELNRQRKIEESKPSEDDWEIEQYLIDQYDVYQDKKWLTSELQIEEYFKEDVGDYFDCGQGYSQDEANLIVKIGKRFFEVNIYAEIGSAKQNIGDRLYWVENIEKVEYKEIEKPIKKDKLFYNYSIKLSEKNKVLLEKYLKRKGVEFKET